MPPKLSPVEFERSFTIPITATAVQFLLYGVYAVLFFVCVRILITRKMQRYKIHLATMTCMFTLTTSELIINMTRIYLTIRQDLADDEKDKSVLESWQTGPLFGIGIVAGIGFLLVSFISDSILLWRLYVVWGRQIKAIVLPVLMCTGSNVLGIACISSSYVDGTYAPLPYIGVVHLVPELFTPFVIVVATTHLVLTLLIAGRILYIRHYAKAFLARSVRRTYKTAIIATVESGMIYPLVLLLFAFSRSPGITQVTYYSLELIMGIANTLIIVRTGLGIRVDDE